MNVSRLLSESFLKTHPEDASRVLEALSLHTLLKLLKDMDAEVSQKIIQGLSPVLATHLILSLPQDKAVAILENMDVSQAVNLCRRLVPAVRERLLLQVSDQKVRALRQLLTYKENTVGAFMDPQVWGLSEHVTVQKAWAFFHQMPQQVSYYVFVVDAEQRLVGVASLRQLLNAKSETRLSEIMSTDVMLIPAHMEIKSIMTHPAWLKYHILPVVDEDNRFLGAIRYKILSQLHRAERSPKGSLLGIGQALGELYGLGVTGLLEMFIPRSSSFRKDQG